MGTNGNTDRDAINDLAFKLMNDLWLKCTDAPICDRADFDAEAIDLLHMIADDCAEAGHDRPWWYGHIHGLLAAVRG